MLTYQPEALHPCIPPPYPRSVAMISHTPKLPYKNKSS